MSAGRGREKTSEKRNREERRMAEIKNNYRGRMKGAIFGFCKERSSARKWATTTTKTYTLWS